MLKITYRESVAYQVNKPGKTMPGASTSTDVSRVPLVKVKDLTKLDQVAVGDIVDITYTEALALAVERAGHE